VRKEKIAMWNRALTVAAIALAIGAVAPMPAAAQFDHLECYKIKDSHKFEATADLVPALTPPFPVAAGCEIQVKGRQYCVAVDKQLTSSTAPSVEFPTTDVASDFLCYKVKCPKADISDTEVTDQFGTRTISRFKTIQICAPAVVGPPPPFTCTAQTPLTCGQGNCPAGNVCQLDTMTLACACVPQ
jgi:hypothetical protein